MTFVHRTGLALAALAAAGCAAVGPDYAPPELPVPAEYQTALAIPVEPGRLWWEGFEDPVLDGLVAEALSENMEVGAALAALREVEALAEAARADLSPGVDGGVSADAAITSDGDSSTGAGASLFAGLPVDLFGRQRRAIEQAQARADGQAATVANLRRLTAASVADVYVELRRTTARLELLDTSLELQSQTLEIVRQRFEAGLSADLDVRRAEADLSRTRAQRGTLSLARDRAAYTLSVLLGRNPDRYVVDPEGENTIPVFTAGPPAGPPAELVRQRPDLRAAEANLAAAVAGIGVETADLYPALSIPGTISADLTDPADIAESVVATISAGLDIPIFDGGRRRAELTAAEARAEGALLAYRQALLESLSDVETALVAIQAYEDRRAELEFAVTASEQAFDQLNALYREGLATFIDILDAQRTLIGSRESYVDSQADLASAIIGLYAALGAPTEV